MYNKEKVFEELSKVMHSDNIKRDELLREHLYTKLGGRADFFLTPTTYEEVQNIVKLSNEVDVPFTLLGNGSNLIVKDGGIRGIVLHLKNFKDIKTTDQLIVAQSGAAIIDVSRRALAEKLSGLEFACGIPGTVGGALFMNAGAYGGEIKDVLDYCHVVDREGNLVKRTAAELELDYRHSNISEKGDIVLEATFSLKPGDYEEIKAPVRPPPLITSS